MIALGPEGSTTCFRGRSGLGPASAAPGAAAAKWCGPRPSPRRAVRADAPATLSRSTKGLDLPTPSAGARPPARSTSSPPSTSSARGWRPGSA